MKTGMRGGNFFVLCVFLAAVVVAAASPARADSGGEGLYLQYCSVCHQPDGEGIPGFFPPLAGNPLVISEDPRKIQEFLGSVIFGYHGGLVVKGTLYSGTMPPIGYFGRLNDSELLALINYQRTAWGHSARPVTPADLARAREAYRAERESRWELLKQEEDLCVIHYDSNNITFPSGDLVRVWMRTTLNPLCEEHAEGLKLLRGLGGGYEDYEYNKDLYEIDCSENTFRILETRHVAADGRTIKSTTFEDQGKTIPEDSVTEALRDTVCR